MKPQKYPKALIFIHWLTVVLLAIEFYAGITMEEYEFNEANMNRYRFHALLGVALLLLTLVRLIIKKKNKDNLPEEITYYSDMHKKFIHLVQFLIYAILLIAPVIGFIMVYQTGALDYDLGGPFPEGAHFNETLEELHKFLVFLLAGLVGIHVAGIIMYNLKNKENLIKRMCMLM